MGKRRIIVPEGFLTISRKGHVILTKSWKKDLKKQKLCRKAFSNQDDAIFIIKIPKVSDNNQIYKISYEANRNNRGIEDIPKITLDFFKIRDLISIFDGEIAIDNDNNSLDGLNIINGYKFYCKRKNSRKKMIYSLNPKLKKMYIMNVKRVYWQRPIIDPKYLIVKSEESPNDNKLDIELIDVCGFERDYIYRQEKVADLELNINTNWKFKFSE